MNGCSSIYEREMENILDVKKEFNFLTKEQILEKLEVRRYSCKSNGNEMFLCVKKSDNLFPPYACIFKINISYEGGRKYFDFKDPICAGL